MPVVVGRQTKEVVAASSVKRRTGYVLELGSSVIERLGCVYNAARSALPRTEAIVLRALEGGNDRPVGATIALRKLWNIAMYYAASTGSLASERRD